MLIIFTDSSFEIDGIDVVGGANRGISTIQEAQEAVITHYETVLKPRIKAMESEEPHSTLYLIYNNGDEVYKGIIARVCGTHYGEYLLVEDSDIYTVDLKEEENGEGTATEEK